MSVDTKGLLKGKVSSEKVLNFIQNKFDKNATISHTNIDQRHKTTYSTINFSYKEEDRELSYMYTEGVTLKEEYNIDLDEEFTWIKLGANGCAVEVIKTIVTNFGGYIDENDCDDIGYTLIENR